MLLQSTCVSSTHQMFTEHLQCRDTEAAARHHGKGQVRALKGLGPDWEGGQSRILGGEQLGQHTPQSIAGRLL